MRLTNSNTAVITLKVSAEEPLPLPLRLGLYTLAQALLLTWILLTAEASQSDASFQEGTLVEHLQLTTVLLAGTIFLAAALRGYQWSPVMTIACGLTVIAATSELDSFLDDHIPLFGWQGPAVTAVAVTLVFVWTRRHELPGTVGSILTTPAGLLAWMGFVTVVIVAQLVGHGDAWKSIMGDSYSREYKRTLEEMLEMLGYVQILCAAVEAHFLQFHVQSATRDNDAI